MSSSTSSSDEEDMLLYYHYKRKHKQSKSWVHPYLQKNRDRRLFIAAKELKMCDSKFLSFYRMTKSSYLHLVELMKPSIYKQDTNMRECVGSEERILITLRYLATGDTFVSLGLYFARGETTVGNIVGETTPIIWNVLKDIYMPLPNTEKWKSIAQRFETVWNLPNCIGALDGKHVRIEKFPRHGSTDYNYKSYNSVVLMACCDADGLFSMIETGFAGRNSDGGIFRASAIKYWLMSGRLNIPEPSNLPNDGNEDCLFPYYFVGDEAFPLSRYLMRPFSKRGLDNMKRVFNYRLSRGRKTIECTFGMMAKKFQVLNSPIRCRNREKVNDIIKAVCILHNYVRKREGIPYTSRQPDENEYCPRNDLVNILPPGAQTINAQATATALRNYLANYFITPTASLPWQWKYCL